MERYDPAAIEARWQKIWHDQRIHEVPNPEPGEDTSKLMYVLEMLPYPSGELHMGHVKNYTMGDVLCHFRRRNGLALLHPMGYDAFGLPAENAAIREGSHPREVTDRNIAAIRRQLKRMGWSIDWSRELSTADPDYYRWTQWLFLRRVEGRPGEAKVLDYARRTAALSEEERAQSREKTGVDTGRTVINPVNGEAIPVWVADYVVGGYGTGAIMAVPAHDDRDFAFA